MRQRGRKNAKLKSELACHLCTKLSRLMTRKPRIYLPHAPPWMYCKNSLIIHFWYYWASFIGINRAPPLTLYTALPNTSTTSSHASCPADTSVFLPRLLQLFQSQLFSHKQELITAELSQTHFQNWPQVSGFASGILSWQSADRGHCIGKALSCPE